MAKATYVTGGRAERAEEWLCSFFHSTSVCWAPLFQHP